MCFYVHETLKVRSTRCSKSLEALLLTISSTSACQPKSLSLTLGCIYRPPHTPVTFWDTLLEDVDDVCRSAKTTALLLGDLNVNILDQQSNQLSHLKNFCNSAALRNVIASPTRLPSNTCLDLALVPFTLERGIQFSGHLVEHLDGLSAHSLILVQLQLHAHSFHHSKQSTTMVRKPPIRSIDPHEFGNDVRRILCSRDITDLSLNDMTIHWTQAVQTTLDQHSILTSVPQTTHPPPSPWMTHELRTLIYRRRHTHRKWKQHPDNDHLRQNFRAARRAGTLLNRRLRAKYHIAQFTSTTNNPRAQWQLLNRLLGRHKPNKARPWT